MTVGIGLLAIYTSYVVGQVRIKHPHVQHYADAVGLMWGRFGYELTSVMFVLFLVLITGSHVLTGTIVSTVPPERHLLDAVAMPYLPNSSIPLTLTRPG